MDLMVLEIYFAGAVLIGLVLALGQGADWWDIGLEDDDFQPVLFLFLLGFWPVFIGGALAALIVGTPCWLAYQAGKRLRK